MTFSENLKKWMKAKNLTIKGAAIDLGVPMRTLQDWLEEKGHRPHPDRQKLIEQKLML